MDHEDEKTVVEFSNMLCGLGAHYINENFQELQVLNLKQEN